jgi:hypothetical protein
MSSTTFLALGFTVALALSSITTTEAHGYISLPAATYRELWKKTAYNGVLNASSNAAFVGKTWNDTPETNAQTFRECFRESGLPSLRALIDPAVPDCGNSRTDIAPIDVSSLDVMQFQNDEYKEGLISSHHGPCEVWIDTTRVFRGSDCVEQFRGAMPARFPVDYSVCPSGQTCTLMFYWLPLHEAAWQVYKQCVPITRRG